jgi:hypothetical protein
MFEVFHDKKIKKQHKTCFLRQGSLSFGVTPPLFMSGKDNEGQTLHTRIMALRKFRARGDNEVCVAVPLPLQQKKEPFPQSPPSTLTTQS